MDHRFPLAAGRIPGRRSPPTRDAKDRHWIYRRVVEIGRLNWRWLDDLLMIYRQLGGQAPHTTVYRKMKALRTEAGRSWPEHAEEIIRQTLQAHNAESPQYRDGLDLFRMVRPGLWCLKDRDIH